MPKLPSSPEIQLLASRTIEAGREQVRELAETLQALAAKEGWAPEFTIDLELALVEAANNIVIHGYAGADGQSLEVDYACSPGAVLIELRDHGASIPVGVLGGGKTCADDGECGRGMAIIRACVDDLLYESGNGTNRMVLIKKTGRSAE